MKNRQYFIDELKNVEKDLGFDLSVVEQGSPEWLLSKCGVVSASRVIEILKKGKGKDKNGNPKPSVARGTYLDELVCQIAKAEMDEVYAKPMQWGKDYEAQARSTFELVTGFKVYEFLFIIKKI